MSRDEKLRERWDDLVVKLSAQFSDGDPLELDGIIYLVGVQELRNYHLNFGPQHPAAHGVLRLVSSVGGVSSKR